MPLENASFAMPLDDDSLDKPLDRAPKVALVNDTSAYSKHFGCQLVGQTFREQFARLGLDLTVRLGRDIDPAAHAERLAEVDLVVLNGEGTLHHGRGQHLVDIAKRWPTILVNCVWQENPAWDALEHFRLVSARESLSAAALREQGVECQVVPDVIFASMALRAHVRPEPSEDLGYTDSVERKRTGWGPWERTFGFSPNQAPGRYLDRLGRYRRLCAGRFHAAVCASVLGIPFSTWESNTWKTRGMMADMGLAELHFETFEEAFAHVPTEIDPRATRFAEEARGRIVALFDRIGALARELAASKV